MTEWDWRFGGLSVRAFGEQGWPVAYAHMDCREAALLAGRLERVTLAAIEGADWNDDLTPWPAEAVFQGQPGFGGGAGAHLKRLTGEVMPKVEAALRPGARMIAGYSLAGMFALYAALETAAFDAAASVSGSLWYPGFVEYVERMKAVPGCVYLSVGERERLGRNPAFHSIEDRTRQVESILRGRDARTIFERNPGGHFQDPMGRVERALRWLTETKSGE